MSFKVDMTSPDVDRQLALLEFYPEILEKYFRPALGMGVKSLEESIRPTIPVDTGRALAAFKSRVTGKGLKLEGKVGWWGKGQPWYINVVEYGAKPHKIGYVPRLGVSFMNEPHPGFSARGFMAAGFAAMQPMIDAQMAQASESVVNELVVK
jgi:hypothetical protein